MAPSDPPPPLQFEPAPSALPREQWYDDLQTAAAATAAVPWVWQGYVARGKVTLRTSPPKLGKTTLLSILLAKLKAGGTLAGQPVTAGRAAVVSEEAPADWLARGRRLDLAGHVCWFCRPFAGKPRPPEWHALLDRLAALRAERGVDLAVIDPLAHFLPGRDENHATLIFIAGVNRSLQCIRVQSGTVPFCAEVANVVSAGANISVGRRDCCGRLPEQLRHPTQA